MKLLPIALLLLGQVRQDPAVDLAFRPRQGDRITYTESSTSLITATIMDGEPRPEGVPGPDFRKETVEKALVDFLEVDKGVPTRKSIDYRSAILTEKSPAFPKPIETELPLSKRKITLATVNGKLSIQGAHGLDESILRTLTMSTGNEYKVMLPPSPVKVGDDWKIAGDDYKKLMDSDQFTTGFMYFTFKAIREVDGRRCAIVTVEEEGSTLLKFGRGVEGLWIDYVNAGEMVVWIDRGYALSVTIRGTLKAKSQTEGKIEAAGTTSVDYQAEVVPAPEKR